MPFDLKLSSACYLIQVRAPKRLPVGCDFVCLLKSTRLEAVKRAFGAKVFDLSHPSRWLPLGSTSWRANHAAFCPGHGLILVNRQSKVRRRVSIRRRIKRQRVSAAGDLDEVLVLESRLGLELRLDSESVLVWAFYPALVSVWALV
jgi:hypothetical protein